MKALLATATYVSVVAGLLIPVNTAPTSKLVSGGVWPRETSCENTPTSRSCWGNYNIDTDYYNVVPDTGVTREVSQRLYRSATVVLIYTV